MTIDGDGIYWWHSIELPDRVTPGQIGLETLETEWRELRLPPLQGRSVLDIGAWDGWFSFAAEDAGASRVVALDQFVWSLDFGYAEEYWEYVAKCRAAGERPAIWGPQCPWWDPSELPGKRAFDTARAARRSRVESVVDNFMTCDLAALGTFDVTLFLGVLYHVKEPLTALQRLRAVTGEVAVVETAAISLERQDDLPLIEFTPGAEVKNDATNWFFPNEQAAIALLRAAGFEEVTPVARLFHSQERQGVTDFRLVLHARPRARGTSRAAPDDWDWLSEREDDPLSEARQRAALLEAELAALRGTRTFRYTEMMRRPYGRLLQIMRSNRSHPNSS
jgi:tRNA (mo5U34)-methyltransferase